MTLALQDQSKPHTAEAPGSWRTSLRKAGSSVTLGSAGLSDSSQDPSRPPETGLGMTRSASSPRLSSEADAKVHATVSAPVHRIIFEFNVTLNVDKKCQPSFSGAEACPGSTHPDTETPQYTRQRH